MSRKTITYEEQVIEPARQQSISIITYNVKFLDHRPHRSWMIPLELKGIPAEKGGHICPYHMADVVTFQEVFHKPYTRNKLIKYMQFYRDEKGEKEYQDYPWFLNVGPADGMGYGSGVLIFSRYEIVESEYLVYESVGGGSWEIAMSKGATYAKIKKGEEYYHLFATHTQADDPLPIAGQKSYRYVRKGQFHELADFIKRKNISADEPVFIAGDLNLPRSSEEEFPDMLSILAAECPDYNIEYTSKQDRINHVAEIAFSWDQESNTMLDGREKNTLDYILFRHDHLRPERASLHIFKPKDRKGKTETENNHVIPKDLSDHYAVYGYFEF